MTRRIRRILLAVLLLYGAGVSAQGHIIEVAATDSTPAMNIYHPAIACPEEGYPVLYLLHGIRGTHESWEEKGHVCAIVDSLVRINRITPPLIVMPYCFTRGRETQINRIFTRYDDLRRGRFEEHFPALMAYVEQMFPIAQDSARRFIAGLSSGARQALRLADTARCSVVGLMSPVLVHREYPDPDSAAPFYWIMVGSSDAFRPEAKSFARYLDKHALPYHMAYAEGKHTWDVWRLALPELLVYILPPQD